MINDLDDLDDLDDPDDPDEPDEPDDSVASDASATVPEAAPALGSRGRRKRSRPRSASVPMRERTRAFLASQATLLGSELSEHDETARPRVRGDCADGIRPCPWVACSHHLYLDVSAAGNIKINFPDLEAWELTRSCSLDVAQAGGLTLEEVGERMNLTRERTRQIEKRGLAKLRRRAPR